MAEVLEFSPPKRLRKDESEEIEILTLAPFKPVPKVVFQNINVNVTARRSLIVRNPSTSTGSLRAELASLPPEDHHMKFSFTAVDLAAGEEAILEISWTPVTSGSWRESIPVRTSSKFKSEIVILCSSVNPKVTKNVKKPLTSRNSSKASYVAKKLVVPKPFKPQPQKPSGLSSVVSQQVRIARSLPRPAAASPNRRQTFLVSAEDKENSPSCPKEVKLIDKKHDIARRFEDFTYSPFLSTVNKAQARCKALDELVMSPVVLPTESLPESGSDFVDGDQFHPPRAVFRAELDQVSPISLRRTTFAVTNIAKSLHPPCSDETSLKPASKPAIYISPAPMESDEFSDSLEEVAHLSTDDCVGTPDGALLPDEMQCIQSKVLHAVPDTFMDSTIKFDLPLPCEDPRRCSTGVKVNLDSDSSLALGSNVRKDLFQIIVSPPTRSQNSDPLLHSHELNVSQTAESVGGPVNQDAESNSSDRLSCSTFVKDRLSTGTYVKDRLSTGTYIKEQHSRGSCSINDESLNGSYLEDLTSAYKNSPEPLHSPSCDIHHLSQVKSPVLDSIEEEEDASCSNFKPKSTAFTVPFPKFDTNSVPAAQQPPLKFTELRKPSVPRKISPPKRRLVAVSPTLKKSVSGLTVLKPAKSIPSKADSDAARRKSLLLAVPKSGNRTRRASIGSLSSQSKSCLSARLPVERLSLSKSSVDTKMSDQSIFKLPRGSKRIAEQLSAKSEILFNPDEILAEVTNVDSFAASTTEDPFLSCSIYNDSAWINRQEKDMIKWLNALLTPPAELKTNTDMPAIDVGDLWQKTCRLSDVNFAPSREEFSSEHYDKQNRLQSLRKAAVGLYRSKEVAGVLQKISVHVEKKLLSVRSDRDLHLDVGLQHIVLELLLCYNPLWLRIGLETVFGQTLPLKSNSDYVGIVAFIVHNLLSDKHIVSSYSHPTVPHLKLPGFQDEMKKFTLKKFLFIVYFLDTAKKCKLIGHDPCLFIRSANYKESREIVAAFARELLAGLGDIHRYLSAIGCKLTVKQSYLDEFQYGIKELLDLRDGVRLVRVMEIILNTTGLLSKVRVPAISKLQKVHNAEVALNALKGAGYVICGDIQAKHIAEGHREKTLSLIWQIIYKFQAPRFTCAAETLQRWWRGMSLRREVEHRIRARKRARREAAATVLQSAWRGVRARRRASQVRAEQARVRAQRMQAALTLQKHWRRHAAQLQLLRARRAANTIQRWFRGAVLTRHLRGDFLRQRSAATKLQAHWRGLVTRKRFTELRQMAAALRIQTWFRRQRTARVLLGHVDQARLWMAEKRRALGAARRLQLAVRAWLAMRRERRRFLSLRRAAVVLQTHLRAKLAMDAQRKQYLTLRRAVVLVQQRFRARLALRIARARFISLRAAAVTIQKQVRMQQARKKFLALRRAAQLIQERWRGRAVTRICRVDFLFKRRAVRLLQTRVRAWLVGRRLRTRFLALRAAAVVVQRRYRDRCAARARSHQLLHAAAVLLQTRWRAQLAMKRQRVQFQAARGAACILQARYRAWRLMRSDRHNYLALRAAAISIQRRFRSQLSMRRERNRFHSLRWAAVVLQRRWRAKLSMEAQRKEFLSLRSAAISLQIRYRAQLKMRSCWTEYNQLRMAAIVIQRRQRARKEMQKMRQKFLEVRKAVVIIQQRWRAQLAMRTQREWFIRVRKATRVLQNHYRALLWMREQRAQYLNVRSAAITLQRKFRSLLLMREEQARYFKLRSAAITVQQHWRAKKAALSDRNHWLMVRKATITLQQRWRATRAARRDMLSYQKKKQAVLVIQRWWCSMLLARKSYRSFQQLRASAIAIQVYWRRWKVMVQLRQEFKATCSAVVLIQRITRGYLARKNYLQLKEKNQKHKMIQVNAARLIQLTWRQWHAKKMDRKLRQEAAIKIQALWRGHLSRKRYKEERLKLKELKDGLSVAPKSVNMKERISLLCYDLDKNTIGGLVIVLNALQTIIGLSPTLCEEIVRNDIVQKLFNILTNINRGVGDAEIAQLATQILLYICKYDKTVEAVWMDGIYLNLFPHLLKKWMTSQESVLNHFITILWHFSQNPQWAEVIVADVKLKSTILFCLSKFQAKKSKCLPSSQGLPALVPNWGLLKKKVRPFAFEDPLYGLRALCYKLRLGIDE